MNTKVCTNISRVFDDNIEVARGAALQLRRMVLRSSVLKADFSQLVAAQKRIRDVVLVVADSIVAGTESGSTAREAAIREWNGRAKYWTTPEHWILVRFPETLGEEVLILTAKGVEGERPKISGQTLQIPIFASALDAAREYAEKAKLAAARDTENSEAPRSADGGRMQSKLFAPYGVTTMAIDAALNETDDMYSPEAIAASMHDDRIEAMGRTLEAMHGKGNKLPEPQPTKTNKETNMKFKSQQASNSILKSLKFTATHQGGNAGLTALKSLTLKLLPIKWGFWARLTGKHKAVCNHPLTTLAVATGLNLVAQHTLKEDNPTLVATQALQDAAMADAIANYGELQNVVSKLLDPESVKAAKNIE